MELKGTVTAMVTPFIGQRVDEEGLAANVCYQVEEGVNGILVLGSTGEALTLSLEEQIQVISIAVREAKGRVAVWVGTGTNCTKKTIENTKMAKDLGADAALVVTPYYNKPTQAGILCHFEQIAKEAEMPVIVYNNPGRCGVNIETETLKKIASFPHIAGVKEASGSVSQAAEIIQTVVQRFPDFLVFSGDDLLTLPMMAIGASGVVSVASNLIPREVASLVDAAFEGNFFQAKEIYHRLFPFFRALFLETNPVPIKTAMNLCNMPSGACRSPLVEMEKKNVDALERLLDQMQLLAFAHNPR